MGGVHYGGVGVRSPVEFGRRLARLGSGLCVGLGWGWGWEVGVWVGLGGEGRGEGDWRLILAARFSLAGQDSKAGFRFDGV